MTLPDTLVDKLLDKLATDDDFRSAFQRDPRRALASLGHGPAADASIERGIWMCMSVSQLASKEAIAASRDALRAQLLSAKAAHSPILLEMPRA